MKILLVDDHELFRAGLKFLLSELGREVVFVEATGIAGVPTADRFDLVLLDLQMPGISGLDGLRTLRTRFEGAMIVILSAESDAAMIRSVIAEGAAGFIPKTSTQAVMIAALRLVLAGGVYLPPDALAATAPSTSDDPLGALSERQVEALRLAIRGKSNKVIAREMDISEGTVKVHLSAAYRVLGVRNRTEAVFAAARQGARTLVPPRT